MQSSESPVGTGEAICAQRCPQGSVPPPGRCSSCSSALPEGQEGSWSGFTGDSEQGSD